MPAPEPMLSTRSARRPTGDDWVLQAKWDGFRLLVEIPRTGVMRAWSRHGASLGERVPQILEAFREMPAGTIVDGELVALGERGGKPAQDFASVRRAVFSGDAQAGGRLRFVAFDLLMIGESDVRALPWCERDEQLRRSAPECEVVRVSESRPVSRKRHDAIVSLGFEGTVIKRRRSSYRAGRHSSWLKQKARHVAVGLALEVREDRNGSRWVVCNVEGRRVIASAAGVEAAVIGQSVRIVYSRTDADGGLRKARIDRHLNETSNGECAATRQSGAKTPYGMRIVGRIVLLDIACAARRTVWWRCQACGHEWQAFVANRTLRASGCLVCGPAGRREPWSSTDRPIHQRPLARSHQRDSSHAHQRARSLEEARVGEASLSATGCR